MNLDLSCQDIEFVCCRASQVLQLVVEQRRSSRKKAGFQAFQEDSSANWLRSLGGG